MTSMPANAKQEQTERWVGLAAAIALPLIGGAVSSIPTHADTKPGGWYTKLRKPKWTPPNWVFSRVWNVAYIAQGVASWLVWKKRDLKEVRLPLYLYGAQLALNLIWQPIFFKFHKPIIATVDSAAVTAVATAATVTMARAAGNKAILPLMVPYLGWLVFSTTLYGVIAHQNPNELDPNNGTGAPSKKEKKAKKGKADTSPATASGAAGTGSSAAKGPTVTTSNPATGTTTSSTAK